MYIVNRLRKNLIFLFMAVSLVGCTIPQSSGDTISMCAGQKVPEGWVVVSWESDMDCPNWSPGDYNNKNTMNIKRPGDVETICADSPIPPGYVVTGTTNGMECPNWSPGSGSDNQKIIKKISDL